MTAGLAVMPSRPSARVPSPKSHGSILCVCKGMYGGCVLSAQISAQCCHVSRHSGGESALIQSLFLARFEKVLIDSAGHPRSSRSAGVTSRASRDRATVGGYISPTTHQCLPPSLIRGSCPDFLYSSKAGAARQTARSYGGINPTKRT